MKETINKIIDNYKEHSQHDTYDKQCSSCWTENLIVKQSIRNKCIGCGGLATRTNNTLCQKCWQDAEGENI